MPLARELKAKQQCNIVYIGLRGDKLEGLQGQYQVFDQVCHVPAGKFRRYHGQSYLARLIDVKSLALNFRDFFRVIKGIFVSRRLLKKIKPDIVFSKGGYVAVPVGIAAHWLRIPIVTHDSDTVPGLANRLVGRWASIHATGMPAENYSYPSQSVRYVGIPLDERLQAVDKTQQSAFKRQLKLPLDSLVLLVVGGGLGAAAINNKIAALAPRLLTDHPNLHIFHITGDKHQDYIKRKYSQALNPGQGARVKVMGFTDQLYKYSGAADLVVTRAGATILAELAVQNKACVVIPSPFLTGGHQLKNAEALGRLGAAEIVSNDAGVEALAVIIDKLLLDSSRRQGLARQLGGIAKANAAQELAEILLDVAGKGARS